MYNFIGGIAGDIIGSIYEWHNATDLSNIEFFKNGCKYTDDTVLTCAIASWLVKSEGLAEEKSLEILNNELLRFGKAHPYAGYGRMFKKWLNMPSPEPMGSFGNGAGMRVSPVGFFAETEDECLCLAEWSAKVTHDHPEGIKGAKAIALAIYLARRGEGKPYIKSRIESVFDYNLGHKVEDYVTLEGDKIVGRSHKFDATCQTTVPEAIVAFLESDSYSDAIVNAIEIGGDTDTIADMAGAIAGAYYGVPSFISERAISFLSEDLLNALIEFNDCILNHERKNKA